MTADRPVIDDRTDPCGIVMATLASCPLNDPYPSEQRGLQPALRDALGRALRDRFGEGFTVQISVNVGQPPDGRKPHIDLFGTSFWPDIVVLCAGEPILGVEVKHVREGNSPTHAIAETIGQALIYRQRYPRVVAFVLRDGVAEPKPAENEARLREMLAKLGIDLVMRYRALAARP